jgi:hypothetical protein
MPSSAESGFPGMDLTSPCRERRRIRRSASRRTTAKHANCVKIVSTIIAAEKERVMSIILKSLSQV